VISKLLGLADNLRHRARRRQWAHGQADGRRGEDLAHRFLQARGFRIVARNYRTPSGRGEIDLVAWDGATLVFVEVKARQSEAHRAPERAVDRDKRLALIGAARHYARRAKVDWGGVRFDVVSVVLGEPPSVAHHRDAFAPGRAL
jgi:putative endonuclease